MENSPVVMNLVGTAGQSLGVWNAGGLHIKLEGDANDYVGKGMAGGRCRSSHQKVHRSKHKILQSSVTLVCMVRLAVSYLLRVLRVSVSLFVTQVLCSH